MKTWSMHRLPIKALVSGLVSLSFVALSGAANGGDRPSDQALVPLKGQVGNPLIFQEMRFMMISYTFSAGT